MPTTKAAFASSPVAHRVFDFLIRAAVRRLDEDPQSATVGDGAAEGKAAQPNKQ